MPEAAPAHILERSLLRPIICHRRPPINTAANSAANSDASAPRAGDPAAKPQPSSARRAPDRRARQSEQSRAEILDAALAVIAEVGFHGASIDVVARAAGISPTSIYWHFGNREGLFVALAKRVTDSYVVAVAAEWERSGVASPEARIRGYLRALVGLAAARPDVLRAQTALSAERILLPALREGIRQHNREARQETIEALETGMTDGAFRSMPTGLWIDFVIGSLQGASIQASFHREGFDSAPLFLSVERAALSLLGLASDRSD